LRSLTGSGGHIGHGLIAKRTLVVSGTSDWGAAEIHIATRVGGAENGLRVRFGDKSVATGERHTSDVGTGGALAADRVAAARQRTDS